MKFRIHPDNLSLTWSRVSRIPPARSVSETDFLVGISTNSRSIKLYAQNPLLFGVSHGEAEVEVAAEKIVYVEAARLAKVINAAAASNVSVVFEASDNELKLRSPTQSWRVSLPLHESKGMFQPESPTKQDRPARVWVESLLAGLRASRAAMRTRSEKATSVMLDLQREGGNIIGGDGASIAIATLLMSVAPENALVCMIPINAVAGIISFLDNEDTPISIASDGRVVLFWNTECVICSRLNMETPKKWRSYLETWTPPAFRNVLHGEMVEAVRIASIPIERSSDNVAIELKGTGGGVDLRSLYSQYGSSNAHFKSTGDENSFEILLDANRLSSALGLFDSPTLEIGVNSSGGCFYMRSEGVLDWLIAGLGE